MCFRYDTTLADACIALSQRWSKVRPGPHPGLVSLFLMFRVKPPSSAHLQAKDQDLSSFKESDVKTLSSHQLIEFLSLLLQEVNHFTHTSAHHSPPQLTTVLLT